MVDVEFDRHSGACCLRPAYVGRLVLEAFFEQHGRAFDLRAAVVMPNHVHAVLSFQPGFALPDVVKSIKGASALSVNRLLGRSGRLWQPDYFDRVVRDAAHLERCIRYVHWNPVKAGLCDDPRQYPSSTAHPFYAERLGWEREL
jgi:putative transposase